MDLKKTLKWEFPSSHIRCASEVMITRKREPSKGQFGAIFQEVAETGSVYDIHCRPRCYSSLVNDMILNKLPRDVFQTWRHPFVLMMCLQSGQSELYRFISKQVGAALL